MDDGKEVTSATQREVYSNNFGFMDTAHDLRVIFGQMLPAAGRGPGNIYSDVEHRVGVTMPWALAKMLRDSLSMVIEEYESLNGEIRTDLMCPCGTKTQASPERPM